MDLCASQPAQFALALLWGQPAQIEMQQGRAADREQPLHRLALVNGNVQAQPLVPGFQQLPAGLQGRRVELAVQAQDQRHMIGRLPRFQLFQKPEPLLRKGERRGSAARRRL